MALANGGYLHYTGIHKEIPLNSSQKATKKKIGYGHLRIQVSNPGPFWPSSIYKNFDPKFSYCFCICRQQFRNWYK